MSKEKPYILKHCVSGQYMAPKVGGGAWYEYQTNQ